MNTLVKIQLKKIYGQNFNIDTQDEKFKSFVKLITKAYEDYEEEEKVLEKVLDISARELEETNILLTEKKELLKSVENSMDDAIFYKDLDHKYIGCNDKFEIFLNIKEKDLIGKSDYDFFDKKTAKKYANTNNIIIKNKTKSIYKQWVRYKGKDVYVLTSKTALINANEEVIGIVGVSRDITHEYKLQKDVEHKNIMLIQQNKLVSMGEMIANIAHQWRQPLNSLGLLIQKMGLFHKEGLLDTKTMDANILDAMILIDSMSDTIDDFRNFFCNDRGFEDFDVKEAILKSKAIIKPILELNDIELHMDVDNTNIVSGYKNEFFQVLLNLLNNSIEVLVADKIQIPQIKITIKKDKKNIIVNICDNANGILHSNIDKIFNPYFTTKEKGTGLGLYMSKIIIEEHMSGELNVQSSIFGTVFRIVLKKSIADYF